MNYIIFDKMQEHNEEILSYVRSKVSEEMFSAIQKYMMDSGEVTSFRIVKEPKGEFQFEDEFIDIKDDIKGVYIDQYKEDSLVGFFKGTIAIEISEEEYFEFTYALKTKANY